MKNLWNWINGTIRPISFIVGLVVLVGALLSNMQLKWDIVYAMGAGIFGCGFANSFNSLVDRYWDRLNPSKNTLASKKPVSAWYGIIFMLPIFAFCLRSNKYNHVLFAVLYYLCYLYSYSFGRVRILKRIVVATIVALTAFLYIKDYNPGLWLFGACLFVFILARETGKDNADKMEDDLMRFSWKGEIELDLWCVCAPLVGIAIYIGSLLAVRHRINMKDALICFGIAISIWSYIQIRYRYNQYKMKLLHQSMAGRIGAIISVVGLMPTFVTPSFILIVLANISSIEYRSFLPKRFAFTNKAAAQDAALWASLPLMAITIAGWSPILLVASLIIWTFVYVHELRRLSTLSSTISAH